MISTANRSKINKMNATAYNTNLGNLLMATEKVVTGLYDFSVHGGAAGDINLDDKDGNDITIPAGAIVTQIISDELTNATSGGSATVQLKAGSTNLSDAIGYATFANAINHGIVSGSTAVKISADSTLKATIATAALTAGKIRFYVYYLEATDV